MSAAQPKDIREVAEEVDGAIVVQAPAYEDPVERPKPLARFRRFISSYAWGYHHGGTT